MSYGWVRYNPITNLVDWSTFQTTVPPANESWKRVFKFDTCACSELCGINAEGADTEAYPRIYNIDLTEDLGYVTLDFNAIDPSKFQVYYLDTIIYDSGYRGNPARQTELDTWLTTRGYPTETINTPSSGTYTFYKSSTSDNQLVLYVYSPLFNYEYEFSLGCPGTTTTTSTSSTSSTTSSSSTSSSTTSTTTTLPPDSLRIEWDNRPEEIGDLILTLTTVTYNNGGANLYTGANIDLSITPFFQSTSTTSADLNQDVEITFTNGSDVNVTVSVYMTDDANPETLIDTVPVLAAGTFNETYNNGTATYFLSYRLEFIETI